MKTINDSSATPANRRAARRQADRSLFAGTEAGDLLSFEDPNTLASLSKAADDAFQPATGLERLFTDHLVRSTLRTLRLGKLQSAAIDVEMSDHREALESQWGKLDPGSLYHLVTRDPATRSALREATRSEGAVLRRLKQAPAILKALRTK